MGSVPGTTTVPVGEGRRCDGGSRAGSRDRRDQVTGRRCSGNGPISTARLPSEALVIECCRGGRSAELAGRIDEAKLIGVAAEADDAAVLEQSRFA